MVYGLIYPAGYKNGITVAEYEKIIAAKKDEPVVQKKNTKKTNKTSKED